MSTSLPQTTFASLGLSPSALEALGHAGFKQPTPIQERAIPVALTGTDLIGCAATGTGKTAAFALPMIERLAGKTGARGLVLAPTRELALQIAEQFELFSQGRALRSAVVIGGLAMEPQARALRTANVIIGTPGRLVDHLQQGTVTLDAIEILVLDEADRMLDMGFKPQLTRILARLPRQRQTLLFSATMAGEVAEFAARHLKNPTRVEISRSGTTAARVDQAVYRIKQLEKPALLLALLEENDGTMLVFTRTKRRADKVSRIVERAGHAVERIHADRSQGQRQRALQGFKEGRYRVLVATDIAARGIDVEEIAHVVNFDLPHVPEDYVHRIGRTARAASSGRASSFASDEELTLLREIERFTRQPLPLREVPRDSRAFVQESERSAKTITDPGPRQPGFGVSGRPAGKAPGRHARTHKKSPAAGAPAAAAQGGRHRSSAANQSTPTHGTWRPRRRR